MVTIDFAYVNYNSLEDAHPDLVPIVQAKTNDDNEWEHFFHDMPQAQLEVVICLYLGFKPAEIVKILKYPNIARFYNMSVQVKNTYRKRKTEYFDL
jgi:hypothetical protein